MAVTETKVFSRAGVQVWDIISTVNGDTTATLNHAAGRIPDYVTLTSRQTTAELWTLTSKTLQNVVLTRAGVAGGDAGVQLTAIVHWSERHGA